MRKMKISSINSVGEIPSHWIEKELKFCLNSGAEGIKIGPFGSALKAEMLVDVGFKVYGQENLIKNDFSLGQRFIDEKKFNELMVYEIKPGDVLISMMGTIGKCKVVPKEIDRGIMDSHLIRLSFDKSIIIPEFAAFLIQESFYIKTQLVLQSKGSIMSGLNSSIIKNLKLILPPLIEQTNLLRFTDSKSSRIDSLIDNKQKLINLLNEKRQSVITESVTKGLNPKVKMKDSGVEWIGEIPEHWEIKKIKHLTTLKNKKADENADLTYVGLENIESKTGKYLKSEIGEIESSAIIFQKGNVLFGKLRPYLTKTLLADFDGICTTEILVFETINEIYYNKFLKYQLLSPLFIDEVNSSTYGTKMPRANWSFIGNTFIPVPPIKEQRQIANYLELKEVEIDRLVIRIKSQIQKLKEYRQSLIYEAVTGKIDVRELIAEK